MSGNSTARCLYASVEINMLRRFTVDLSDEEKTALMMIPLIWASKMIQANKEFAEEMDKLDIKGLLEELCARAKDPRH